MMSEFTPEAAEPLAEGIEILLRDADPEALATAKKWASRFFDEGWGADEVAAIGARIMMGAVLIAREGLNAADVTSACDEVDFEEIDRLANAEDV